MGFFDGLIAQATAEPLKAIQSIGSAAAPLIGAAGSMLGQTSANNANAALMAQGNAFNASEAEKDRVYQTEQRATQYQTAVKDLMAAGLNPMLAYTQGGARPTSGAQASSTAPPKMENVLGNAANSAATSAMALNNVMQNKLIDAQINKTDKESANIQADTVNKLDTNPNIKAENKRILADIAFKDTAMRLNSAQAGNAEQGIAPSSDPYWYRDLKRSISSAAEGFGIRIFHKR
ncbi:MAG: DNA pilot protein [Arizlama microvirus]|nr:MAG: DNA pilot protein [Arizlama microvirus]